MSETLSFPGLGLEFTLNRVAFSIGPLTVYWYGVIIAALHMSCCGSSISAWTATE